MDAVILAGGRGSRLNLGYNKCVLPLKTKSLLEHAIDRLSKYVHRIVIVGGCYIEDISHLVNKHIEIISHNQGVCTAIQQGITHCKSDSILLALGDEYVVQPQLDQLIDCFEKHGPIAVIAHCARSISNSHLIRDTFSIEVDQDSKVTRLIEKPTHIVNHMQGTGHAILSRDILNYVTGDIADYPTLLQRAINDGQTVHTVNFCNDYFNINTLADLERLRQYEAQQVIQNC